MPAIENLAVVALLVDLPAEKLIRGQVGTIVEVLSPEKMLVEFSDESGRTYGLPTLNSRDLMVLHHHPAHQLA